MAQLLNLHINSFIDRQILDETTSKWTSYLSTPINISSNDKKVKLNVDSIEIPNILYNFGTYDSIFWYYVPSTLSLVGKQIATDRIFDDGPAFVNYMNGLLAGDQISFSYSSTTHKLTITNNNVLGIIIPQSFRYGDFTYADYNSAIDKLGFTQKLNSVSIGQGVSVEAQSVLKLLRTNCYYLTCSEVTSSNIQSLIPSPYRSGSNNIIARISAGNFGSLSQLSYLTGSDIFLKSESINRLSFSLLDDNFYEIEDFYLPITMTLKIQIQ
jgi:hypothetical protein